jgi:hypothetical protein
MLYFGRRYVSTVKGVFTQCVRCENCNKEYSYKIPYSASGSANSPYFLDNRRAASRASSTVAENLASGHVRVDVPIVPCPACKWYEGPMAAEVRKRYGQRITLVIFLPLLALLIAVVGTASDGLPWVAVSLAFLFVAIVACRVLFGHFYEANWRHPNYRETTVRLNKSRVITHKVPTRQIVLTYAKTGIQAVGVILLIGFVMFALGSMKHH